jgi:hypothetical protein
MDTEANLPKYLIWGLAGSVGADMLSTWYGLTHTTTLHEGNPTLAHLGILGVIVAATLAKLVAIFGVSFIVGRWHWWNVRFHGLTVAFATIVAGVYWAVSVHNLIGAL